MPALDHHPVIKAFDRIGATAHVSPGPRWTIDVETTRVSNRRRGAPRSREIFQLTIPRAWEVAAVDVRPSDRHLLLHVMRFDVARAQPLKYLAGHDERHWFAASIPGRPASVAEAKRALMPDAVGAEVVRRGVKASKAARRRNAAFLRQGEWFFVPMQNWTPGHLPILENEPISRGTLGHGRGVGSPHWCEELVRVGVETWAEASADGRFGKTELLPIAEVLERRLRIRRRFGVPRFCAVRRTIKHRDHATVDLGRVWHRVEMNTETAAPGRGHVLFLD
jgi:hypothetical protein